MESAKTSKETEASLENPAPGLKIEPPPPQPTTDLGMVLDLPLRVSVELGRTKMLVQDLLQLHKGSVIELTKPAGESLEVLVNEKVLARGEVVVVNDKFGIRLTDIISHPQRIRQLGE